jgi:hypothetical protein
LAGKLLAAWWYLHLFCYAEKEMTSKLAESTSRLKDQLIQLLKGLPWGSILVKLAQQIFNAYQDQACSWPLSRQ